MCALEIKGVFNGSEVNEVIDDQFVMDKPDLEGRIRRGFRGSPRDFGGGMKITAIRHGEMVLPDGNIVYINMPAGRIDLDPGQKMILRFRGEVVRLKGV